MVRWLFGALRVSRVAFLCRWKYCQKIVSGLTRFSMAMADIREYTLLVLNDSLGHYAVDEHNGILLDAYYMDDCLYSVFAGMGSQLQSRVCLEDDRLNYEISSFFEEPIRTSGDTIIDTDTIPPIQSFEVYSLMRAQLFRE